MSAPFVMPPRLPSDGALGVRGAGADRPDELHISVVNNGFEAEVTMSRFNAARLFGTLALFLDIPLPKKIGKAIKFGAETMATYTFTHDGTIGGRLAASLAAADVVEKMKSKLPDGATISIGGKESDGEP